MSYNVLVKAINSSSVDRLISYLPDSFNIQWQVNDTYSLSFTAWDDGSAAFANLTVESTVTFDNTEYVIKQATPDDSSGLTTVDITATHIYSDCSRVFQHNVKSGDASYTPGDILKYYLDGNKLGYSYSVIGKFDKQTISDLGNGSAADALSTIVDTWPDCVIFPDGKKINVYDHDSFYKDHGNRIDYLNNASEISLDYDSTDIVNQVEAIGPTFEKEETVGTGQYTQGGAANVVADAKKYLGVPYVWGGHNKANPRAGMDCSGFVSQVYHDFGIEIPAYTVSMEAYGHQVSTPQTGDMLFYGSHGASHHIALALDSKTMIYEPQPGEVCKMTPISYYPPQWVERNDKMAKVVAEGGKEETTTETSEQYYFQPFIVQDDESIKKWGVHPGADVTSDTIQKADEMKKYVLTQLKPDPSLSITVTTTDNMKVTAGDMPRVEIRPRQYVTVTGIVSYEWYPFSKTNQTSITLNETSKTILDYEKAHTKSVNDINATVKKDLETVKTDSAGLETWTGEEVSEFGSNIKRS
ncbi:phage tail protein [Paucilactobacillus sp. N302-9]